MSGELVEMKSFGEVYPKEGGNPRTPYPHQQRAMDRLSKINQAGSYGAIIAIPTGGGKTYTASLWLLSNAIDKHVKILWMAHRQMLLDQAAASFQKFAYKQSLPHVSSFSYRIISGASGYCQPKDIKPDDNLLIVSKDSIGRNLQALDKWLEGEREIFLVVDEAHHSTAKTYRKVIDYVRAKVPAVKLIGLTATPTRTAESEQGLLKKIYADDIAYKVNLKDLVATRILSRPIIETKYTDEEYGKSLGLDALESIQRLDKLPDKIASQMAGSTPRNKLIVDTYCSDSDKYGQTIVFAVNITHAVQLATLFNKANVKAAYVISNVRDSINGASIGQVNNELAIEDYRQNRVKVLVNVNILTEGVDLPMTKSVFLARPTSSSILMTQMIGRALRGEMAGGTPVSYIVSFVDKWGDKRLNSVWATPERLMEGTNEFDDTPSDRLKRDIRVIAVSKIEEFASILDDAIDTTALEKVPFIQRIPLGMYVFSYMEQNGMDHTYQVMVYDSTKQAYDDFMASLPELFESFHVTDEYLPAGVLEEMEQQCHDTFFCGEMLPAYEPDDIINLLKYYAEYETVPKFYPFDDSNRHKLDVSTIAKHIWDEDMGERKQAEYLNSIWDSNDLIRLYFVYKNYFLSNVGSEKNKLGHPDVYEESKPNVQYGAKPLEELSLYEIRSVAPNLEKELRNGAFAKAMGEDGAYHCAACGFKSKSRMPFQVDHIVPMSKGGKSVPENLQILCRMCNGFKADN